MITDNDESTTYTLPEIPLADAGSLTTGPNADTEASFELNRLPKPSWRIGV